MSVLCSRSPMPSHLMSELKTKSLQCPTGPSMAYPIILLLFILTLPLSSCSLHNNPSPNGFLLLLDTPSACPPQSFCTCCSLCLDICKVNALTSCGSFPLPISLTLFLALFFLQHYHHLIKWFYLFIVWAFSSGKALVLFSSLLFPQHVRQGLV